MIFSILGPSGSGKDTQARLLMKEFGTLNISTGRLLREEVKQETKLGQIIKSYISKGYWTPDDITFEILQNYLKNTPQGSGYILNGFPRTKGQIPLLDKFLLKRGEKLDLVIHFILEDNEVKRRMHKQFQSNELRTDTWKKAMEQRMMSYKSTIKPVLDEYKKRGILINIDASPSIEKVHEEIIKKIKGFI